MNNHAIGIEVHSNGTVFDKDSKDATKHLVQMLMERHGIPKENVIRHLDYTNRKRDIGENFWRNEYKSYKDRQDSLVDSKKIASEWEQAIEMGITNGERPKDFATREEVAIMILRATK